MATKKRPAGKTGSSTSRSRQQRQGQSLPPPPPLPATTAPNFSRLPCPARTRRSPLPKPPKRLP